MYCKTIFFFSDSTLTSDNPIRFRKNLLEIKSINMNTLQVNQSDTPKPKKIKLRNPRLYCMEIF